MVYRNIKVKLFWKTCCFPIQQRNEVCKIQCSLWTWVSSNLKCFDFVPTLPWSAKWLAEYLRLQVLTETTFRGPADILVSIARILSQWFHVYFCPYSPLPAWIFPNNLVDMTRQHHEAAACHWVEPSLLSDCQVSALLPDLPLSWEGHGELCKFTSITPPLPGEQTWTSFSSSATQGDRLTNALVISGSGNPGTRPLVSSLGVPALSQAIPGQQCHRAWVKGYQVFSLKTW